MLGMAKQVLAVHNLSNSLSPSTNIPLVIASGSIDSWLGRVNARVAVDTLGNGGADAPSDAATKTLPHKAAADKPISGPVQANAGDGP